MATTQEVQSAITSMVNELRPNQRLYAAVSGGTELLPPDEAALPETELAQQVAKSVGIDTTPAVAPAATVSQLGPWNTGPIVFGGGVPVGGWAQLTLYSNGSYNFTGHFHGSGATSYDTALVWAVKSWPGTVYTFAHKGRVHGTFEAGSRDDDWGDSGTSSALAQGWGDLWASWRWSARVNLDIAPIISDIIQAIGATGSVIAIVSDRALKRDVVAVEWSR
jgi:hypothetical protein